MTLDLPDGNLTAELTRFLKGTDPSFQFFASAGRRCPTCGGRKTGDWRHEGNSGCGTMVCDDCAKVVNGAVPGLASHREQWQQDRRFSAWRNRMGHFMWHLGKTDLFPHPAYPMRRLPDLVSRPRALTAGG